MDIKKLIEEKRDEIIQIAEKHGASNIRVFGSVARGEDSQDSDIDFIVDVGPNPSPWFPVGLIHELEELLGHKVDIVTENSIYWLLRRRILKEAVLL